MRYPVFLISLAKDEARRDALRARFASFDKFNLIDAVDGRTMSAKEYFGYANASLKAYGKLLSPAEVGCALSHVKAYEAFLASGAPFGLVFEDDVIGDDEGIERAFELAQNLTQNSIFICGCQDGLAGRFSAFGKRISLKFSRRDEKCEQNLSTDCDKTASIQNKNSDFYLISKHSHASIYRAGAYILTQKSAKALLDTHTRALCTADLWGYLLKINELEMYFCDLFAHPTDLSGSNIESERNQSPYKPSFSARLKSLKFILLSRLERYFSGYERVFKDKNAAAN